MTEHQATITELEAKLAELIKAGTAEVELGPIKLAIENLKSQS